MQRGTAQQTSRTDRPIAQSNTWPVFDEEMVEAVTRVLRSGKVNYWTGEEGRRFEQEFAEFVGCGHAIALANGTLALELALHALGIGPGDEVVVPSRTFIATASSVVARGARPVCADVDRTSQTITSETIAAALTSRTKAIIVVHLAGWPCDMDPIVELAAARGIAVVEDCAQAHGAEYRGRPVGSIGDVGAFSFCQDKIMTTGGEGGMLVTNRPDLWDRAWRFKDHGKRPEAFYAPQSPSPQFRWLHDSFGSNYRMTEMQAAIGRIALRRLPEWVEARRRNAATLARYFNDVRGLRTTTPPDHILHSYYKYYVFVCPEMLKVGWSRDRILKTLCDAGVACASGSCSEIYREKAFATQAPPPDPLPVARELGETSLMFLVHPTLNPFAEVSTAQTVQRVMQQLTIAS